MRTPKFVGSCLCALLCMAGAISPVKSEDRPRPRLLLKNVSLVVYSLASPKKAHCTIDFEAWNTAIDFLANQSIKLKLIRQNEHFERARELMDQSEEARRKFFALLFSSDKPAVAAAEKASAEKAWEEAREIHSKYSAAPNLSLGVETLEQNEGCFGSISASVTTMLTSSKMISTGTAVGYHSWEIWSTSFLLVGPPSSYSRFVIETSERMMKSFVNDWTLSQEN